MIISCPQCDARYDLPDGVFNAGSRKMKCASCGHVWIQDEVLEANDAPFRDMLNRAREEANSSNNSRQTSFEKQNLLQTILSDFRDGLIVIMATCILLIGGYVGWSLITSPSLIYGQGLAFDDMKITREGDDIIVTGDIVNSMKDPRGLPNLKITKLMNEGIEGDSFMHAPPVEKLDGGASVPVTLLLPDVGAAVQSIDITFAGQALQNYNDDKHHHDDEHH